MRNSPPFHYSPKQCSVALKNFVGIIRRPKPEESAYSTPLIPHNCGGVCACSTCHIYVLKGEDQVEEISDKEEDFIDRAINPKLESRLACQCIILDADADIVVQIPDQNRIIGHEH